MAGGGGGGVCAMVRGGSVQCRGGGGSVQCPGGSVQCQGGLCKGRRGYTLVQNNEKFRLPVDERQAEGALLPLTR